MHKFLILICSLLFPLTIMGNDNDEKTTQWGDIDYDGEPWVKNISYPAKITHGLQGRHLLAASQVVCYHRGPFYPDHCRPLLDSYVGECRGRCVYSP